MTGKSKKISAGNKSLIVSVVHFALTFVFERFVLYFDTNRAMEVAFQVPLSNTFSMNFERIMCYIISKLMAAVLIFVFWKAVFYLFGGRVENSR